jgi:hypothetical protein
MRLLHRTNIEDIDKPIRFFFWAGSADKKIILSSGSGYVNQRRKVGWV